MGRLHAPQSHSPAVNNPHEKYYCSCKKIRKRSTSTTAKHMVIHRSQRRNHGQICSRQKSTEVYEDHRPKGAVFDPEAKQDACTFFGNRSEILSERCEGVAIDTGLGAMPLGLLINLFHQFQRTSFPRTQNSTPP